MSAGELADHFSVSKPTMSAHFAVLREAGLVASEKRGQSVVYELQLSVLEDALLSFARAHGKSAPRRLTRLLRGTKIRNGRGPPGSNATMVAFTT